MDRITKSRDCVNQVINLYHLNDETILKIVDKSRLIFDAGMDILEDAGNCEDAIDFYKNFEHYLQMSPIEKFHFDWIVSTVHQAMTGMQTLEMLVEKIELFANEQ